MSHAMILAARDLAAKKWSLCVVRVCLLSKFVVFAVGHSGLPLYHVFVAACACAMMFDVACAVGFSTAARTPITE